MQQQQQETQHYKQKRHHKYIRDLTKTLGFKEFDDLFESAITHVGNILDNADAVELACALLGAFSAYEAATAIKEEPFMPMLLGVVTGLVCARGLSSRSEVVGAASISTLMGMGLIIKSSDVAQLKKDDVQARQDFRDEVIKNIEDRKASAAKARSSVGFLAP